MVLSATSGLFFHFPVTFSYLNQYFQLSEVTIINEHFSYEMGEATSDLAHNCCYLFDTTILFWP